MFFKLDIDLDDIVHHVADALDDGLDMAEALGGLLTDATGQHFAGGHVERQLAGDMVVVREGDALGMQRASRCLVGIAGADHQIVSVFHQLGRGAVTVEMTASICTRAPSGRAEAAITLRAGR